MNAYEKVILAAESVRKYTSFVPDIAMVLGSGLGGLAEKIERECVISARDIQGYPLSTVSGHSGRLIFGYLAGKKVVVQQGRAHFYEGYSMQDAVLPVRLMCYLGAQKVILTNAAGGIDATYNAGDFMLIKGQIAQFVPSPLVGENDERFGERFPDMSKVYSEQLISLAKGVAKDMCIDIKEGVYVQASGPNYETPEEVRAFGLLGANAVGMSTAVEAIAVKHMKREILGISLITNKAAGFAITPLNHEEVKAIGAKSAQTFEKLLLGIVAKM